VRSPWVGAGTREDCEVIEAYAAVTLMSRGIFAQGPAKPAIEVATVKLNKTSEAIGNQFDPERMRWTGVQLKVLIEEAYRVQPYQIAGGPAWIDTDRWDIDVKLKRMDPPAVCKNWSYWARCWRTDFSCGSTARRVR
jgi:hypothetical protein